MLAAPRSALAPASVSRPIAVDEARSASASASSRIACGGRGERDRIESGGRRGCRRVNGELGGVSQALRCGRHPRPTRRGPCVQTRPARPRTRPASTPARRASSSSIQGRKSLGARRRKRQQQVRQIALRVDGDHGHAVDRRLLDDATGTAPSCRCRSSRRRPHG